MLYIGHFSFSFRSGKAKRQPWHGYFTAVAEASNVTGALKKLEALIVKSAESSELFSDISEVFLESCVEVKSVPRPGFLVHVALEEGDSLGSISTTLPAVDRRHASTYSFEPDAAEEDGGYEAVPFVVLKKAARKRAARRAPRTTKK
jgi:hypothetical protein